MRLEDTNLFRKEPLLSNNSPWATVSTCASATVAVAISISNGESRKTHSQSENDFQPTQQDAKWCVVDERRRA